MADDRLGLINSTGLTVHRRQNGRLTLERRFAADDSGIDDFYDYLRRAGGKPIRLVADLADESYRSETLPFVRGNDRRHLHERKQRHHCPNTPFALTASLGRQTGGRRDERILFLGLTGNDRLDPWLAAIRRTRSRLAGLYSAAQLLAGPLAQRLHLPARSLLITHSRAGLRQTLSENGWPGFSRLLPLTESDPEILAEIHTREIARIQHYLIGQRLLDAGTDLPICIIAGRSELSILQARLPRQPEPAIQPAIRWIDLATLLPPTDNLDENRFCDRLLLDLAHRWPPRRQFAPADDLRYHRLAQIRTALHGASALILGIGLIAIGERAWHWRQLVHTNNDFKRHERQLAAAPGGEAVPLAEPHADTPPHLAREYRALLRRAPQPLSLLQPLSHALTRMPEITLVELHWHLSSFASDTAESMTTATADNGEAHPALEVLAELSPAGTITPRQQINLVQRFAAAIDAGGTTRTRILAWPPAGQTAARITWRTPPMPAPPPAFTLRIDESP